MTLSPLLLLLDETGASQHLQMFGHRRATEFELGGESTPVSRLGDE